MFTKGKAMSRAPIMSGMRKFPKALGRVVRKNRTMIVPCMVTAARYWAGSRRPFWGHPRWSRMSMASAPPKRAVNRYWRPMILWSWLKMYRRTTPSRIVSCVRASMGSPLVLDCGAGTDRGRGGDVQDRVHARDRVSGHPADEEVPPRRARDEGGLRRLARPRAHARTRGLGAGEGRLRERRRGRRGRPRDHLEAVGERPAVHEGQAHARPHGDREDEVSSGRPVEVEPGVGGSLAGDDREGDGGGPGARGGEAGGAW